jgi:ABC-type nitrate/sulfonate/bicarbonate transport system substrate-binding protein
MGERMSGRTRATSRRAGGAGAALAGVMLLGVCGAGSASASPALAATSLTSVTIAGSFNADFGLVDIADQAGFFKDEGIQAKLVNTAGLSASNLQSAFSSGSYTFEASAAPSEILAAAAGATDKAIFGLDIGQQQQVAISGDVAQKDNIPTAGATPAQTMAQVAALKGSHISLGISNLSAGAYNYAAAVFHAEGVTYSPASAIASPSSNTDVSFDALGTTNTFVPAMAGGKIDGFILPPPVSNVKGATIINLGNVEPVHSAAGLYLAALDKTITGEPATVQRVVDAMVRAWQFAKANPAKAEPMLDSVYTANGITSPSAALAHVIYNDDSKYWVTPAMPQAAFTSQLGILAVGQGKPVNIAFSQFADPMFVNSAIKSLKVTVPQGA